MTQAHHIEHHGANGRGSRAVSASEGTGSLSGGRVALRRTPPAIMGIGIFLAAIALAVVSAAYGSNDDSSSGSSAAVATTTR